MPIPDHMALPDAVAPRAHQDALFDQHRAGLEVTVWNRTDPINGVPADHFLARPDVPASGDIYLIGANGHVQVFQPHHPEGGPIAPGAGKALGETHADMIAAGRVHSTFVGLRPGDPGPHDPAVAGALAAATRFPVPASAPHPQPPPPAPAEA